jgi:hypothetical protein
MKLVATLLVWLALLFGLLQVLICCVVLFSSGWAMPLVLIFSAVAVCAIGPDAGGPSLAKAAPSGDGSSDPHVDRSVGRILLGALHSHALAHAGPRTVGTLRFAHSTIFPDHARDGISIRPKRICASCGLP